jgi:hypothetical protein
LSVASPKYEWHLRFLPCDGCVYKGASFASFPELCFLASNACMASQSLHPLPPSPSFHCVLVIQKVTSIPQLHCSPAIIARPNFHVSQLPSFVSASRSLHHDEFDEAMLLAFRHWARCSLRGLLGIGAGITETSPLHTYFRKRGLIGLGRTCLNNPIGDACISQDHVKSGTIDVA